MRKATGRRNQAKEQKKKQNRGIFMKKENAEFIYVFKNTEINRAKWQEASQRIKKE